MKIIVKAPTRIDIAGGTLDIQPLSAVFAPSVCVNVAVNLYATVSAVKGKKGRAVVHSSALGRTIVYSKVPEKSKTLFHRLLDIYPADGWEFTVDTLSPAGAGLGGSSAMLIAFIKAVLKATGRRVGKMEVLEIAKNIEARHLGIPTGVQDYLAALNGGLNVIESTTAGFVYGRPKLDGSEIEKRVLLFYSGKSRISGDANWAMFKKALDGDKAMVNVFRGIARNSLKVLEALEKNSWSKVGACLLKENGLREKLGRLVVPPSLAKIFKSTQKLGGYSKICGAGGGGCFIVWCGPKKREAIKTFMREKGMTHLDFKVGRASVSTR